VVRRSGLGKGLGALIPPEQEVAGDTALQEVPVSRIRPNPRQPRRSFDEEALGALAASVRELGLLQPVLVRSIGGDDYELIAGERRWRAAKRAGLPTIPVIVRQVDDLASLEQAVVENLHRQDLNPLEEAAAYQQLIEDFSLTHDQLAARVGRSRVAVTNALRLFQLPPAIQRLVAEGQLSGGHARALLGTPDRAFQEALARRVVRQGLSVRANEESVRARNEREPSDRPLDPAAKLRLPGMIELEHLLSEHLETRVQVEEVGRRGRVVIDFADVDDLERIYRAMTGS
jgi:ParB family transcriptional regulator, chromosome partitioning protein